MKGKAILGYAGRTAHMIGAVAVGVAVLSTAAYILCYAGFKGLQAYDKYAPSRQNRRYQAINAVRIDYMQAMDKLRQEPNVTNANAVSSAGMVYYWKLYLESDQLISSNDILHRAEHPAPREIYLDDFVTQTDRFTNLLAKVEQPDDGGFDYIRRCLNNAAFRVGVLKTIKEKGTDSDEVQERLMERAAYATSPMYIIDQIHMRDGQAGFAAVEHEFYFNLYNELTAIKALEPELHLDIDLGVLVSDVMYQTIEQVWNQDVDPDHLPDFIKHFYRDGLKRMLINQGYSEKEADDALAKVREEQKVTLIISDEPISSDFKETNDGDNAPILMLR